MTSYIVETERSLSEQFENGSAFDKIQNGRSSRSSSFASETESVNMNDTLSLDRVSNFENNNTDDSQNDFHDYLGDLPVSILTKGQRKSLGRLLDRPRTLGGDFKELAGKLFPGISSDTMYSVEKRKEPTLYLLEKYAKEKKDQATISALTDISVSMRRLDVVKELLQAARGHLQKHEKKKGLLTRIKKKLFQDDDTISICSVQSSSGSIMSLSTLKSYPSYTSLSSYASYANNEWPLKEGIAYSTDEKENINENSNSRHGKNDQKAERGVKSQNNSVNPGIFLVAGSDETENLIRLVKWLRLKGVDARSVHTDKLEYDANPSKYVKEQLESAEYVLIICSAGLEMLLDRKYRQGEGQLVQYVFDFMNREWFTDGNCISKYIPLLGAKTPRKFVPMPLNAAVVSFFDTKDNRKDLLMRLNKQEKYKLPDIGSKPIFKQNVITGELSDLRK